MVGRPSPAVIDCTLVVRPPATREGLTNNNARNETTGGSLYCYFYEKSMLVFLQDAKYVVVGFFQRIIRNKLVLNADAL